MDQTDHPDVAPQRSRREAMTIVICVVVIVASILVSALRISGVIGPP